MLDGLIYGFWLGGMEHINDDEEEEDGDDYNEEE